MKKTLRELFGDMGHDFETMPINEPISLDGKWKVLSCDLSTGELVRRPITRIVKKELSECFRLIDDDGNLVTNSSGDHRYYVSIDNGTPQWRFAHELVGRQFFVMTDRLAWDLMTVIKSDEVIQIADIEVADTHSYFSNGVLSHNTMYGDNQVPSGGKAIPFHASVRIKLGAGKHIENAKGEVVGIHVNAKTVKNKVSPPFRGCEFRIYFGIGIKEHEELFDFLREQGEAEVTLQGKKYRVNVEGTSSWKTFTVVDADGVVVHEKKFNKSKFDEVLDDPAYKPFLDKLIEAHMVRKMSDVKHADVDTDSYDEVLAISDELQDGVSPE